MQNPQSRCQLRYTDRLCVPKAIMTRFSATITALLIAVASTQAPAQPTLSAAPAVGSTLVIIPAFGEVRQPNDEARLTLTVEEQDKDKAQAASRVNLKMKQGIEIVRREDPQAQLKSRGYYTYPVYADEAVPKGQRNRQVIAWRIGQYLDVTTLNLAALPKLVAATQRTLSVNALSFGLSSAAARRLDEKRIAATYQNLTERIAAIAAAMGRKPPDAVLDTLDFDGSGAYAQGPEASMAKMSMRADMAAPTPIEEPSFEPGETALQMRLVAKVRFK